MNEIEKLYETAGVAKILPPICFASKTLLYCSDNERFCADCTEHIQDAIPYCRSANYPPFTAEKQLSLMAFLINRKVGLSFKAEQGEITGEAISRGLAGIVNRIWQDLTETEREEIRKILKGERYEIQKETSRN